MPPRGGERPTDKGCPAMIQLRCVWRASLQTLARDQRGTVMAIVGLAIIPLFAAIGLAIDGSRGYLAQSRLWSAVDAAALAGGRVYTSATRDDDVRMYFETNFP